MTRLQRLLLAGGDPDNPGPQALWDLFHTMRRIAVVGMSRDPQKAARRVPSYLAARGFEILPVNPYAERILGRPVHPALEDVPRPVDLVIIFRPTGEAGGFVRAATHHPDEPAIWLQEGIFAHPEIAEARALGRVAIQDLCAYTVHRALEHPE
ncbi:MAG: CoA-binding protein [Gemmatimonadota bacterium]|nr:CoA-binding protein [Gemmatimonadota bacterium]MDH5759072.1 CoA-binding protein [Gemmatimonadota bacterium]